MPDRWLKRFCEKVVVRQIFEELFKFLYIIFKKMARDLLNILAAMAFLSTRGAFFFALKDFDMGFF